VLFSGFTFSSFLLSQALGFYELSLCITVLIISFHCCVLAKFYMQREGYLGGFFFVTAVFVASMVVFVRSNSLLLLLVG